jgi:hypothetical protein
MNETPQNEPQGPPQFGGKPGETVPAVDPDDVRTAWQIGREVQARYPGKNIATGAELMKQACKPGANIQAVTYRAWLVLLMTEIAPEKLVPFTRNGQLEDAVFLAAAKVPAEWMRVGVVREAPPFDVTEFVRLCTEHTKP